MTVRAKAIGRAAVFRAHLRAAEAENVANVAFAIEQGYTDAADALTTLGASLARAHMLANIAAQRVADAMGDDVNVYSGGDDKPPLDPPPGP